MKGSVGKHQRSKKAFAMKQKSKKKLLKQKEWLKKIEKWKERGWDLNQLIGKKRIDKQK